MSDLSPPIRPVSDTSADDSVLPFAVEPLDVRGRVVRLGPSVTHILEKHAYPAPVARLLGEALALTVLLGSSLKLQGRLQLQTRTDGAIDILVVDFDAPDKLRAYARFDKERLADASRATPAQLLGRGHLAFTIDQGSEVSRYQGVVPLDGQGLEAAAHEYFAQSEQIPTLIRLAVAESISAAGSQWRAGGLMVQFLPTSPERQRVADLAPGDAPAGVVRDEVAEDESWREAKALAATIADDELVDPTLSSERLLYRLFHERGVTVFEAHGVHDQCRCSQDRISAMLRGFSAQERADMTGDDGLIGVTCEFCSTKRVFALGEFA